MGKSACADDGMPTLKVLSSSIHDRHGIGCGFFLYFDKNAKGKSNVDG